MVGSVTNTPRSGRPYTAGTQMEGSPMNRLIVSLASLSMVAASYFGGAAISSALTHDGASAAEAPCTVMCPSSGHGGQISGAVTIHLPSGGVGGSVTDPVPAR